MMVWLNAEVSMHSLMWLFLAAFMIHDFEEIITVEGWMKRNYKELQHKVPSKLKKRIEVFQNVRADRFAFAVFLEFIIFIPVTWLAVDHQQYLWFVGFNAVLLIHVFTHVGHCLYLRSYTPGVVTAVLITLPYSIYLLYRMFEAEMIDWTMVFSSLPVGFLLLPIILVGHKLATRLLPER